MQTVATRYQREVVVRDPNGVKRKFCSLNKHGDCNPTGTKTKKDQHIRVHRIHKDILKKESFGNANSVDDEGEEDVGLEGEVDDEFAEEGIPSDNNPLKDTVVSNRNNCDTEAHHINDTISVVCRNSDSARHRSP